MNAKPAVPLAPPGAGLPKMELLVGRILFTLKRTVGSRTSFSAQFCRERTRIGQMVQSCDRALLTRRVLIARATGMEDSSRDWSVLMALDHLRIVHRMMARVIEDLTNGRVPHGTASTAAVKPNPHATPNVIGEYEESCDALLAIVSSAHELKTQLRYAHPWFGPMNAFGWHAMAAGHMGIHRVQIERICAGLRTIE